MTRKPTNRLAFPGVALVLALLYLPLQGLLLGTTGQAWARPAASTPARGEVMRIVVEEARRLDVPATLALALARIESGFRADAESPTGARGVMQIMPATARDEFGVAADELWQVRLNVQLGLRYLQDLAARYGCRWDLALSHYNGGSLAPGATAPKAATVAYVEAVLAQWRSYAVVGGPAEAVPAAPGWFVRGIRIEDSDADLSRRRLLSIHDLDDFAPQARWRAGAPIGHHH